MTGVNDVTTDLLHGVLNRFPLIFADPEYHLSRTHCGNPETPPAGDHFTSPDCGHVIPFSCLAEPMRFMGIGNLDHGKVHFAGCHPY